MSYYDDICIIEFYITLSIAKSEVELPYSEYEFPK